jgi:hypothetical protein
MADGASGSGWGLRNFRDDARPGEFLLHVFACAREPALGLLAAHRAKTPRAELGSDEASLDERRFRLAELSVECTLRANEGASLSPVCGHPQPRHDFDPTHDLTNLIANAEAVGIAVTWCELDVSLGGFVHRPPDRMARRRDPRAGPRDVDARSLPTVTIGDLVVVLNPAQAWIDTFEVVLHELAHVLLGHLGPRPSVRQAPLMIAARERPSLEAREFEADGAACLVRVRRGGGVGSGAWMFHLARLSRAGAVGSVDLLEVFRVAEILAAWCRMRPQSVGVLVPRGPRPVGPSVDRVGQGEDRALAGEAVLA